MTLLCSAYLAMELARFGMRSSLPMSPLRQTFAMRFVDRHMERNDIDRAEDGGHLLCRLDAKIGRIYEGTTNIQKLTIAKQILSGSG